MDWIFGRDVVVGLVWFCGYHEVMPVVRVFLERNFAACLRAERL
jgi:hypothetical protein